MTIRSNDPRWKTADSKAARSMLNKEQIVERLFQSANRLYDGRVDLRKDYDVLADAYDDATGLMIQGMYGDKAVKATRDMIHELDQQIGLVARQMETLARSLKQ